MNVTLRLRLIALGSAIAAIWCGWLLADESYFLPSVAAGVAVIAILMKLVHKPIGAIALGFALFGYIVGNRGFAQLSAAGKLPLLPAELVLLLAGGILFLQCARHNELPLRRDPLNLALLLWMLLGTVRVAFDLRPHGFAAVRDYALVYYTAFFFLVQDAARDRETRRFLLNCFFAGCAVLLPMHFLYELFPEFFLGTLTFRGGPLIYYKGDLAGIFMAAGAVLFFLRYQAIGRWWNLALSLGLSTGVFATNNRASMLGLVIAAALLALGRRWRFAAIQGAAGIAAALVMLIAAYFSHLPWEKTPVYGAYERALSLVDPFGQRSYSGEDTYYKGENNLFRAVWWRAVYDETTDENPWFGLGFGHDLAERFLREYFPSGNDEFSARSPHNVLFTIYGRLGVIGLLPFLFVVAVIARLAIRAMRAGPDLTAGLWCAACVVLTGAMFGVVLEGPMGAIVFWSLLGLANAALADDNAEAHDADEALAEGAEPTAPALADGAETHSARSLRLSAAAALPDSDEPVSSQRP